MEARLIHPLASVLIALLAAPVAMGDEAPVTPIIPGTSVVILTRDGRSLRGKLDVPTGPDVVCLRDEIEGGSVRSCTPIALIESIAPEAVDEDTRELAVYTVLDEPQPQLVETPEVVGSLSAYAWLANWDSDSTSDGLFVHVQPVSRSGAVLPVEGTLRGELWVERCEQPGDDAEFIRVASWQRMVSLAHYNADGAVVRLPLEAAHTRCSDSPFGVVRLRLIVPSQGAFDAVISDVPLQIPSWSRDRQQLLTGDRRFPFE